MSPAPGASGRCTPAWPKDALRITFGVIWLIDATLKWLPGFRASYMDTIMAEAQGQPGWLKPWFDFWIRFQHPDAMPMAWLVAVMFSLLIWATAEGFGGTYTSGASDIGTAIIYAVVFAALLALSYYAGPSRYSADYYIEKRISWWWKIAETRRPVPAQAPTGAPTLATMSATTATNGTATESRRAT